MKIQTTRWQYKNKPQRITTIKLDDDRTIYVTNDHVQVSVSEDGEITVFRAGKVVMFESERKKLKYISNK